jgi:hypothetical protein
MTYEKITVEEIRDAFSALHDQNTEELVDRVLSDYDRGCEPECAEDHKASETAEHIIRTALTEFVTNNYQAIFQE